MTIALMTLTFILGIELGEYKQEKEFDKLEIKTHKIYIVKKSVE